MQTKKGHNIIQCTVEELSILQPLARTTFTDTYGSFNTEQNLKDYLEHNLGAKQLAEELKNPDSSFYISYVDELPAGYLKTNTGRAQTEPQDRPALEIERIYVLAHFQGQSLGADLIKKAIDKGKELQVDFVWLGVWEKNPKAISFYEHMGFEAFGTHTFRLGDDDQTDIMMRFMLV